MAAEEFEITIRSAVPEAHGADLSSLLDKLEAVKRLHEVSVSAEIRPGSGRPRIPREARGLTALIVTHAKAGSSLSVGVQYPFTPPSYQGDYARLADRANRRFRGVLIAAARGDEQRIQGLFPEKADRSRALSAVVQLASGRNGSGVSLKGVDSAAPLYLNEQTADWAKERLPTVESEGRTFVGLVRRGQLGPSGRFVISDGKINIPLQPRHGLGATLKSLFGEIVEVRGRVVYGPSMRVKEMDEIEFIRPFVYSTHEFSIQDRVFVLVRPLDFKASSDPDAAEGFLLENKELGTCGYGRTLDDAIESVAEDFASLWDEIVLEKPDNLHPSALPLREFLQRIVKRIESPDE